MYICNIDGQRSSVNSQLNIRGDQPLNVLQK